LAGSVSFILCGDPQFFLNAKFQLPMLPGSDSYNLGVNPILRAEVGSGYNNFFQVGMKEACIPNFSFIDCLHTFGFNHRVTTQNLQAVWDTSYRPNPIKRVTNRYLFILQFI
jgi:hypothetical protein